MNKGTPPAQAVIATGHCSRDGGKKAPLSDHGRPGVVLCRKCHTLPASEGMPYCEPCEGRILDRMIEQFLGEVRTRTTPRRNTFRR